MLGLVAARSRGIVLMCSGHAVFVVYAMTTAQHNLGWYCSGFFPACRHRNKTMVLARLKESTCGNPYWHCSRPFLPPVNVPCRRVARQNEVSLGLPIRRNSNQSALLPSIGPRAAGARLKLVGALDFASTADACVKISGSSAVSSGRPLMDP
jgi:hypothetical protein